MPVGARQVPARGGPHLPRRAGRADDAGGALCRRRSTTTRRSTRSAEALEELLQGSPGVEGAGALLSQGAQAASAPESPGDADGKNARAAAPVVASSARSACRQARRARERAGGARGGAHASIAATSSGTSSSPISTCRRGPTSSTSRSSSTSSSCAARRAASCRIARSSTSTSRPGSATSRRSCSVALMLPQEGRARRSDQGQRPTSTRRWRSRGARCRTRCGCG